MSTIKNQLLNAMAKKNCRVVVKLSAKWKYVPKAYYAEIYGFERNLIIEYFCKEFINTIADSIPAVIIEEGDLPQNQLEQVKEYAKELGLIVVDEEIAQGIKTIMPMKEYGEEVYIEDRMEYLRQIKWKYLTKKTILKSKM